MRRPLLAALLALSACKKETTEGAPPAATSSPPPGAAASAPPPAAPPASPLQAQIKGSFAVHQRGSLLLLEDPASKVFFVATARGVEQLKDLRRGPVSKVRTIAFLGSPPDALWAVTSQDSVEGPPARKVWRRSGDFWGEAGSEIFTAVAPWSDGRALGLLADSHDGDEPTALAFRLAGGKGPVALPRFTPFPPPPRGSAATATSAAAAASAAAPAASTAASPAPSGPAAPASAASAAGSAGSPAAAASPPSGSTSPSGSPTPEAPPAEPAAAEAPAARCKQRLTVSGTEVLATLPGGQVFVVGHDCTADRAQQEQHPAVERWDPARKKNSFDVLPEPSTPQPDLAVVASSPERAFVVGLSPSPYVAVFDGSTWKTDAVPWASARQAAADATGRLWVVTAGGQFWQRDAAGAWSQVTLTPPSGAPEKAEAIAAQGERVWAVTAGHVFANLPAPAKLAEVGTIEVNKPEKSDYWDFSASPLCAAAYVKVGLVRQPGGDVDKNFPGLRDALRGKGLPAMEFVYEDRGGQQYLGLRAPSVEVAERVATLLREADPKSGARVICNDPRGFFVKKSGPLDLGS